MTRLSSAPRRLQRSRRGVGGSRASRASHASRLIRLSRLSRLIIAALATVQLLGPAELQAATQAATQPRTACPDDPAATPPSEALALKNAAQELRGAESWAKASRLFRDAVEELPDCATYADERILWSLWAVETFERADIEDDGELLRSTEDAVTKIEATPNGRLHPDYPRLVDARARLRASARWQPRSRGQPSGARAPFATRLGIGVMATGAPVLLTGTIVAGVYSARANGLTGQLTGEGGVYEQWTAASCGPAAEPGEAAACKGLRDTRADIRREGQTVNTMVITSLVMVAVGSVIVLAGLGSYLHGRSVARRHAQLRVVPTFGGLAVHGRF